MRTAGGMLGILVAAACTVGVELQDFKPAQGPAGIAATARLTQTLAGRDRLAGELVAVGSSGIVILLREPLETADGPQSLVRVPLWMMRWLELEQMGRHRITSEGSERDRERLERLSLVSRYPQGLSGPIERRLLDGLGQRHVYVPRNGEPGTEDKS